MGRLADAVGALYLGFAALHHVQRNGTRVAGLAPLAEHALAGLEREAQEALRDACANFPGLPGRLGVGRLVALACAPLGEATRLYRPASDALTKEVSRLLTTPSALRDHLSAPAEGGGAYMGAELGGAGSRMALLFRALPKIVAADALAAALKKDAARGGSRAPSADEAALLAEVGGGWLLESNGCTVKRWREREGDRAARRNRTIALRSRPRRESRGRRDPIVARPLSPWLNIKI